MGDTVEIEVVDGEAGLPPAAGAPLTILGEDDLKLAVTYLQEQYNAAKQELDKRNKKLRLWRRNVEAFTSDAPKNTPMVGSSNINVPLTQTIHQGISAKIKGTFDARKPTIGLENLMKDEKSIALTKIREKYLNLLADSPTDLNWPAVREDIIDEGLISGGIFAKVIYSEESGRVIDASGAEHEVVYHDGPEIIPIKLDNVLYRRGVASIARLPFICTDSPLTKHELTSLAAKGEFDGAAVEKVLTFERKTPTESEEGAQENEMGDTQEVMGLFDITEVFFYWDIRGDGIAVDLLFTVHMESGTVLKQQYNTLGVRSLVSGRYIHRAMSLTGRGIGQITESGQAEVTGVHNLRNDNMKVANMRMILTKRNSGLKANEKVYPGKIIEMDNPDTDIRPFQLGEVYPSSLQAENNSWGIFQKASGISDNQLGFADATMGSRDSVRGSAMREQNGDGILGSAAMGFKVMFSQIFQLVWLQLVANRDRVIAREKLAKRLDDAEIGLLQEALDMTIEEVPTRMSFIIKTSDVEKTFEAKKQALLSLTQLYSQWATQTIPLAAQLFTAQGLQMKAQSPDMWNYMARVLTGSSKLMDEVFGFFGQLNSKDYVPDMEMMDKMLDMAGQIGQQLGGMPGVQQAPQIGQGQAPMGQQGPNVNTMMQ